MRVNITTGAGLRPVTSDHNDTSTTATNAASKKPTTNTEADSTSSSLMAPDNRRPRKSVKAFISVRAPQRQQSSKKRA